MNTLNTPSVYSINAFDPNYSHTFEFYYTGTQIVSSEAIITDNETQTIVYNAIQEGYKFNHTIPAIPDKLIVGKSYIIQIRVYDAHGNQSNLSNSVLFYCFSQPNLYFSNVNDGDSISMANLELKLSYEQSETEQLSEYRYYLYDSGKTQIYESSSYYTEENMNHTIYGLSNETTYYVRAIGVTQHGMNVDTSLVQINIEYNTAEANVVFKATNDSKTGCIILHSNILSVGYDIGDSKYIIENGELILDGTLTYDVTVDGDFCLIVKARRLPLGRFLYTTDGTISLSILCISGKYYCNLRIKTESGWYDIFEEIIGVTLINDTSTQIVDSNINYITVANSSEYNFNNMILFEVYRKNNIYDLRASYL